jgi:LmbE family N-acetylglucosaminyl deacetylase
MKALFVHAHFDDYEFSTAGMFEMWRRQLGDDFRARLIICTDGAAGHHRLSREETSRVRLAEQLESAKLAQCEVEPLILPNGQAPREGCLQVDSDLLAALWKAIRDFEPDYLFAPPLPSDSLAGLHVDHVAVAEAVRKVAYMINVPHAFTPEYPCADAEPRPCKVPYIFTAYDGYMFGANSYDLAVDVSAAFELMVDMTWCHQSQVTEWLPWVGRHDMSVPKSKDEWRATLGDRYAKRNRELGLGGQPMAEVFGVTAWGEIPTIEQLKADLPNLITPPDTEAHLAKRLAQWRGE